MFQMNTIFKTEKNMDEPFSNELNHKTMSPCFKMIEPCYILYMCLKCSTSLMFVCPVQGVHMVKKWIRESVSSHFSLRRFPTAQAFHENPIEISQPRAQIPWKARFFSDGREGLRAAL